MPGGARSSSSRPHKGCSFIWPCCSFSAASFSSFIIKGKNRRTRKGGSEEIARQTQGWQGLKGEAAKLSFLAAFLGLLKSQLVSANN